MMSPDQSCGWIPEGAAGGGAGAGGAGFGFGGAGASGGGAGVVAHDAADRISAVALTDHSRQCERRGGRIAGRRTVQKSPLHASENFRPSDALLISAAPRREDSGETRHARNP